MTVSYVLDVSSSTYLSFTKLLLRWRGSLWKVVWRELVLWLSLHTILGLTYRFVLTTEQREFFEDVASLANKFVHQFPLTFMLGFFVTLVVNRWWDMFINIGWIDE
uniref:Bestrophin homolog n=1 Tax=Plectus sambesii TaxID=2011161 RepID=A0A914X1I3_9BILA